MVLIHYILVLQYRSTHLLLIRTLLIMELADLKVLKFISLKRPKPAISTPYKITILQFSNVTVFLKKAYMVKELLHSNTTAFQILHNTKRGKQPAALLITLQHFIRTGRLQSPCSNSCRIRRNPSSLGDSELGMHIEGFPGRFKELLCISYTFKVSV